MRQRAVGQALDGVPAAHQAARAELLGPHRAARREGGELAQVDDGERYARDRAEAALREPALERHLAAFVAGRAVAARARAPPLVAAAGRLALARAGPAADALGRAPRARGGMEVAEIHGRPVARTMLCGLFEPRHLVSTLAMPASPTTARTPPPAITPVPSEAGFKSTAPAPKLPITSNGMVPSVMGTARRLFLASSMPLRIAS